ncbi:hypothetical protein QBC43DRAFT_287951 [Cladorrhinum sp. PSN259]|nr:hypothetical protein QBC43DRAFT_287951 [Cladorrhinum sp. PSN259]
MSRRGSAQHPPGAQAGAKPKKGPSSRGQGGTYPTPILSASDVPASERVKQSARKPSPAAKLRGLSLLNHVPPSPSLSSRQQEQTVEGTSPPALTEVAAAVEAISAPSPQISIPSPVIWPGPPPPSPIAGNATVGLHPPSTPRPVHVPDSAVLGSSSPMMAFYPRPRLPMTGQPNRRPSSRLSASSPGQQQQYNLMEQVPIPQSPFDIAAGDSNWLNTAFEQAHVRGSHRDSEQISPTSGGRRMFARMHWDDSPSHPPQESRNQHLRCADHQHHHHHQQQQQQLASQAQLMMHYPNVMEATSIIQNVGAASPAIQPPVSPVSNTMSLPFAMPGVSPSQVRRMEEAQAVGHVPMSMAQIQQMAFMGLRGGNHGAVGGEVEGGGMARALMHQWYRQHGLDGAGNVGGERH